MEKNNYGGLLIAFDGPNGVGKSTLIEHTKNLLINNNLNVYTTKEPTETPLGNFTRHIAETLDKESLTCLVAADRYQHLAKEIIPKLKENQIVITDRYVLSSLILQRMDGVDADCILSVNKNILLPDIQIAVKADINIIQSRLIERKVLTRFERGQRTLEELEFLDKGIDILINFGVSTITIENSANLNDNVKYIVNCILEAR